MSTEEGPDPDPEPRPRLVGIFTVEGRGAYVRKDPDGGAFEKVDVIGVDTAGGLWGLVVRRWPAPVVAGAPGSVRLVSGSPVYAFDRWIPVSPGIDFPEQIRDSDRIEVDGRWFDPDDPS